MDIASTGNMFWQHCSFLFYYALSILIPLVILLGLWASDSLTRPSSDVYYPLLLPFLPSACVPD